MYCWTTVLLYCCTDVLLEYCASVLLTVAQVFAEKPHVLRSFRRHVPHDMTKNEFWTRYANHEMNREVWWYCPVVVLDCGSTSLRQYFTSAMYN